MTKWRDKIQFTFGENGFDKTKVDWAIFEIVNCWQNGIAEIIGASANTGVSVLLMESAEGATAYCKQGQSEKSAAQLYNYRRLMR